jgi:hypothetical protein
VRGRKKNRNRAEAKTRKNRKTMEEEIEEERPLHYSSCHRSLPRTTAVLPLHRYQHLEPPAALLENKRRRTKGRSRDNRK